MPARTHYSHVSCPEVVLIDGHLRAETTHDQLVPVLVLDVDEAEANKLLATLDPLAVMAETDKGSFKDLGGFVMTDSVELRELLDGTAGIASRDLKVEGQCSRSACFDTGAEKTNLTFAADRYRDIEGLEFKTVLARRDWFIRTA
jgi:hypothetical protein